jgi:RNA polymerase sigma-70 factor (ECF subfamily)
VHPDRGRLRTFLLASLQHFLANEAAKRRTQKRGGRVTVLSLESDEAEGRYRAEPTEPATPETLYERRWALVVVDRLFARLRTEWERQGRGDEFDVFKGCLLGQAPAGGYAAMASALGTTEGAVKVAVHRLRRRFQDQLRAAIAETVAEPDQVDDEIRYLIKALKA